MFDYLNDGFIKNSKNQKIINKKSGTLPSKGQALINNKMKNNIEMDDIVLLNNPKFKQYLDENIIRNIDDYRGTKFRGVSRNGKKSW